MKLAVGQLNCRIGDFSYNTGKITDAIRWAQKQSADVVVFPNFAISGFPLGDLPAFHDFIDKQQESLRLIASTSVGIQTIIGYATPAGHSIAVLSDGAIRCANSLNVEEEEAVVVATKEPQSQPIGGGLSIQLGASGFTYRKASERKEKLQQLHMPTVFVNHVGGQVGDLFDGGSLFYNSDGRLVVELPYFTEAYALIDTKNPDSPLIHPLEKGYQPESMEEIPLIYSALLMGIRDFFAKQSFKKAILGLSGGIDSAVVAALVAEALGGENVWGILLPSPFSSGHSVKDAEDLARNIGCRHDIIPIGNSYDAINQALSPLFKDLPFGLAEENIQARTRAVILMALSNKFGNILLNTSNKSELAVGYGTLYGDSCGGISVMGDLYKVQVFKLARYINRQREIIPINTIIKPPSAELRPDQKDSDSLPDYDLLDAILHLHIEEGLDAPDIIDRGFDALSVARILRMVANNEYKRAQVPPVLRLSDKAFGHNRSIPLGSLWNRL